jgi:hypothetical protein
LADFFRSPPTDAPFSDTDFIAFARDAMAADYMLRTLHRSSDWLAGVHDKFLRVYRGTDVNLMRSAAQSTDRDISWEILVGALCAHFASEVRLDEPDITCTLGGTKWGLAAKLLYSPDKDRHIDQVVAGAKQVEAADVGLGLVIVNASNLVPHDDFLRATSEGRFLNFPDLTTPLEKLRGFVLELVGRLDTTSLVKRLTQDKLGEHRLKTRGIAIFAQSVTCVEGAMSTVGVCEFYKFRSILMGEEDFFRRLDQAARTAPAHSFP